MKKTSAFIVAMGLLCGSAMAVTDTYTWTPVDESADWSSSANWVLGSTGEAMTSNSPLNNDYWGTVVIDGDYDISYSGRTEGWDSTITVLNGADVTLSQFWKIQKTTLVVDADSTLTLGNSSGNFTINSADAGYVWTIDGTLNFTKSVNWSNSQTITINLGTTGIVNMTNTNLRTLSFTADLGSLGPASGEYGYKLVTRELVTGVSNFGSGTCSITGGEEVADATAFSELELTADNVGKYHIYKENNKITLQYIVAVPEPTTATLSLLALAGLAARRRRK